MTQRSCWFMVPAIFAISSHCWATADATVSAESSVMQAEQQVRDAIANWVSTYNRNDWQALGGHFTENAVMLPPGSPAVTGPKAIAAWEAANEAGFQIALRPNSVVITGNTAVVNGRSCVFIPLEDGEVGVDIGKFLEVRVREADGQWRLSHDAFNSDLSPGFPLADACPPEISRVVAAQPSADLVLINGGVYTLQEDAPWAEAAAIREGRIIAVGSNEAIRSRIGDNTQVVDLTGKMALPGFHDAHVHPRMGGEALLGCNLAEAASVDRLLDTIASCAQKGDGWILGQAFDLGLFGVDGPHRELLDAVTGDRPAFIEASDGHNGWANSRALALAGIDADTPDPAMGVIERDPDGAPSGTLRESAMALVVDMMPAPTEAENAAALAAGIRHLNQLGITSMIDAAVGETDFRAYQTLDQRGELTARIVTSLTWGPAYAEHSGDDFERVLRERRAFASDRLRPDAIKIFLDGVLEGETAALVEPYLDRGHHQGELIVPPDDLAAAIARFDAAGLQVHMHAIGDLAVRNGLDALAAARAANGVSGNRHHIAHLQLIHPDDLPRFAALDVTANFQSLWAYPDDYITELNLPVVGEARVLRMYPIASLAATGSRIVGGSDWNVSSANPLDAIETAVRRQNPDATEGPVLNANERVSLATMLAAYTREAAWLMGHEQDVGSIEVGKQADIVVLDRNLFGIPVTEINEATVVMTLLSGKPIYTNNAAGTPTNTASVPLP